MPSPMFMRVVAVRRGEVSSGAMSEESVGRVSRSGIIDRIQVQQFESSIILPRDPQSGQPTGRRQHQGLTVHKLFDKSSPDLYAILTTGEELSAVTLEFTRTSPGSGEEIYFEITAERCALVGIHTYVPSCLDPQKQQFGHMEALSFTYRRITWTHRITGHTANDDWDR